MHLDEATAAHIGKIFKFLTHLLRLSPNLNLGAYLLLNEAGSSIKLGLVLVKSHKDLNSSMSIFLFHFSLHFLNSFLSQTHSKEALKS